MKVALLSNVTTSVLESMLGKEASVWSPAGFGAWMETALEPPDDLVAFAPDAVYLLLDGHFADVDLSHLEEAVAGLKRRLPACPVVVPDLARLSRDFGEAFYDADMWRLAGMPWSLAGLRELRKLIAPVKKVLALDLDNTLWSGVIGEDGVAGLRPNEDLLREVRALKSRGILLAILSRNNPEDVEPAFASLLCRDDFVRTKVDWKPKSANLAALAGELNLGTDAFVFVDDDPAERAEMRARRPEVCVADFPPQLDAFFPPRILTKEDRNRTAHYRAESKRRELAETFSLDDYLKSLEIRSEIHAMTPDEVPRVVQLSQKTNQFNVRTNRYGEDDIRRFAADPAHLLVTLHAGDRFGDLGLVAFVHARETGRAEKGGSVWEILDWVMSCRAMNRRLEFTVERWVEEELKRRGAVRVSASWRRTAKNAPVRGLYESFGFILIGSTQEEKQYERILV